LQREIPLHRRWADIDRSFEVGAVQRIVADRRRATIGSREVRRLAPRVESLSERYLGNHAPSISSDGQRQMWIEIQAPQIVSMEIRLGAAHVAQRRVKTPINRR